MATNQQTPPRGGGGNFADDPKRASEAGKKDGEHSHAGNSQSHGSHQGGSGNFADDRKRASDAGKKGGSH